MLGTPAASRKKSSQAGTSRIRLPVKPVRAVPPEGDMPPRQPLDLAGVLAKLVAVLDKSRNSRSLTEEFEAGPGVASSEVEQAADQEAQGSRPCPGAAHSAHRQERPGVITAHETTDLQGTRIWGEGQ